MSKPISLLFSIQPSRGRAAARDGQVEDTREGLQLVPRLSDLLDSDLRNPMSGAEDLLDSDLRIPMRGTEQVRKRVDTHFQMFRRAGMFRE